MWPFNTKETIVTRANKINKVLEALDIPAHSEQGKEIRAIIALELLGEEHAMIKNYSAAKFTSSATTEKLKEALFFLKNEGLIKNGQLVLSKDDKK